MEVSQVAAAAAHRLHVCALGYTPRPPYLIYGVVDWDLKFVILHVQVIQSLLIHPHWFPIISTVLVHAFGPIETILENLDLQNDRRILLAEGTAYRNMLKRFNEIFENPYGCTVITFSLVNAVKITFS